MTLPQRTTTVPTPDEIARAAHLAAEQLTNPKYVAGYLGGEMQALLRKFPDEPGIRACTALWVAHVRATVHGPVADQRANAAVLRHLRNHDDRPPAALRQEFPAELGDRTPASASYGFDREGGRWNANGPNAWTSNVFGRQVRRSTVEITSLYGPVRWFDADDNEITSAGAR